MVEGNWENLNIFTKLQNLKAIENDRNWTLKYQTEFSVSQSLVLKISNSKIVVSDIKKEKKKPQTQQHCHSSNYYSVFCVQGMENGWEHSESLPEGELSNLKHLEIQTAIQLVYFPTIFPN